MKAEVRFEISFGYVGGYKHPEEDNDNYTLVFTKGNKFVILQLLKNGVPIGETSERPADLRSMISVMDIGMKNET